MSKDLDLKANDVEPIAKQIHRFRLTPITAQKWIESLTDPLVNEDILRAITVSLFNQGYSVADILALYPDFTLDLLKVRPRTLRTLFRYGLPVFINDLIIAPAFRTGDQEHVFNLTTTFAMYYGEDALNIPTASGDSLLEESVRLNERQKVLILLQNGASPSITGDLKGVADEIIADLHAFGANKDDLCQRGGNINVKMKGLNSRRLVEIQRLNIGADEELYESYINRVLGLEPISGSISQEAFARARARAQVDENNIVRGWPLLRYEPDPITTVCLPDRPLRSGSVLTLDKPTSWDMLQS